MKVPPGITITMGRKEYDEGMELPAHTPESVKKRCADYVELAKKAKEPEKTLDTTVKIDPPHRDGGK